MRNRDFDTYRRAQQSSTWDWWKPGFKNAKKFEFKVIEKAVLLKRGVWILLFSLNFSKSKISRAFNFRRRDGPKMKSENSDCRQVAVTFSMTPWLLTCNRTGHWLEAEARAFLSCENSAPANLYRVIMSCRAYKREMPFTFNLEWKIRDARF